MRADATVRLRVMDSGDIAAGLRLCRASRWNQVARDWELFLALSPDGCRVAVDEGGRVVGSVATLRHGGAFGWVAMVLVDPAHRGGGIGSCLLEEALSLLDDMAVIRLDATPTGIGVYGRAGFREEYPLQRMQRPTPQLGLASAECEPQMGALLRGLPVRPMADGDMEAVVAWDRLVFGADRRALFDALRGGAPEYAWVSGHGELDGYLFGRHGHDFEHLGPLVAHSEATSQQLVTACLHAHADRPYILDVPQHGSWTAWLESLSFTVQRPFTRMYRGERRYRERRDQMFAIMGPEFG